MKNVSSVNSNKSESPKTPGGISKSLLTPCRRVGLSRSWKNKGPSPFISPLASSSGATASSIPIKTDQRETRKRKVCTTEMKTIENYEETQTQVSDSEVDEKTVIYSEQNDNLGDEIISTPKMGLPSKKKSKLLKVNNSTLKSDCKSIKDNNTNEEPTCEVKDKADYIQKSNIQETVESIPVCEKPKQKLKNKLLLKSLKGKSDNIELKENDKLSEINIRKNDKRSPIDLTKECMVVIQKRILKMDSKHDTNDQTIQNIPDNKTKEHRNSVSQALFDSDSDEVPLIHLNKEAENVDSNSLNKEELNNKAISDEDDFTEIIKSRLKKIDKNMSTGDLSKNRKAVKSKAAKETVPKKELKPSSQSSNSDDEDFEIKRTILVRKDYNKTAKPLKAKSTGSITQKDIDELKARIEMKKKLLLAKAVTEDTEELRGLIKKWQKGCQDALMELMDLMRKKFPEKQSMDYSEVLQTLKIPTHLVGYDEENDCFITPDDSNIVLGKFVET